MNIAPPVVLGLVLAVLSADPAAPSHDPTGVPLDQDVAEGSGSFVGDPGSTFRLRRAAARREKTPRALLSSCRPDSLWRAQ
jgi:hypothetical protein